MSQPSRAGTRARQARRAQASDAGETTTPGTSATGEPASAPAPVGSTRRALDPDLLAALEEERDFLLRSLADLEREHDAGDVDDADYVTLRDDYTARAAEVLRALDERAELAARARPPRSPRRTVAAVVLVVVVAVAAGWLVRASSGSRAPGDTITGDIRETSIGEIARANRFIAEAQTALAEGRGDDAVAAYRQAIDAYDRALAADPDNAEAMTYRGWLLHSLALQAGGQTALDLDATALAWLDRAVEADPGYPDARVFRALLLEQLGEVDAALADLAAVEAALLPPGMVDMVDNVRVRLEAARTTSTSAGNG